MSLVNEKNIRELVQKDSISSKSKICYTLKYDEYLHIERQQVINRKNLVNTSSESKCCTTYMYI